MNLKSDATDKQNYIRKANELYEKAIFYWDWKSTEAAMDSLAECAELCRREDLYEYLPKVYNMMGVVSETIGNRQVALSYYYTALQHAEVYEDTYIREIAGLNLGYILMCMKRYTEAKQRFYIALDSYKETKDKAYRKKHYIRTMIYCGMCHLVLEEWQDALDMERRIEDTIKKHQDCDYPKYCLYAFQSGCENVKGNMPRSIELADIVEKAVLENDNLSEIMDIMVILADLMVKMKNFKRVERLVYHLDAMSVEKNPTVYFDLYPFKSKYLLRKNRIDEYITHTKQYLSLYEKQQRDGKYVTARILELQDMLNQLEREQADIRDYNKKLETIALYDSLTGLANRTYLNEYLSRKFDEAYKKQSFLGVELMDIDFFKEYNDTYGHPAGDKCIERVAEVLRAVQNDNVFGARYGGDEFVLVYTNMSAKEIQQVVEEIQNRVRDLQIEHNGGKGDILTVSQGVFVKIPDEKNREWDYNSAADVSLYEAKRHGRNRYHIVTDFI